MKQYQFILKPQVKIPNKLCQAIYDFCAQYVADNPTSEGTNELVKAIEAEQRRLRTFKAYERSDKVYISRWNSGTMNNPNIALYRSYDTYCRSQGCFLNIYCRDFTPSV